MIRTLAPDELEWFLAASFAFLDHSDPRTFARKIVPRLKDSDQEAERAHVLFEGGKPVAGVHVSAPTANQDDQNLYLSSAWFKEEPAHLKRLVAYVLYKYPHEAAHYPLHGMPGERLRALDEIFPATGFSRVGACDLRFALAELPPLGLPLVLEAWTYESDSHFREIYARAEGIEVDSRAWAYLKRWRGKFTPDLWFIARETPDQVPVGYAFYGSHRDGIEGVYYMTAVGVLKEYRTSTEMLRRLLLSSMRELAGRSPLGSIRTTLLERDPKLIRILESLGFDTVTRYQEFVKLPWQ